ncbi:MAG: 2,3-bisphosphoglycerate-independent phosphoglycerate mutase [Myxococcota bacterium]
MALDKHAHFSAPEGPVVCVVMDGVGIGAGDSGDAVALAHTPTLDWLKANAASGQLAAHGTAVGMPSDADMGNSEVGHNALGAGRIFDQGAKLVEEAIQSGSLFEGQVWRDAVARVHASGEPLHFLGLLSDGNVHSHIGHLFAMLKQAAKEGVRACRVHALLDGRDVPARSALTYVAQLEALLAELSTGGRDYRVASGGGRMTITMDRYEADWPMVARGWGVHVRGQGRTFPSLTEAVQTLYGESDKGDQDLEGFVIAHDGAPVGPIRDGAAVLLFNFRGDRAIEISKAFEAETMTAFERGPRPDVFFAGMMQYDGDEHVPARFLVAPPSIDQTMGEHLAASGKSQYAISETQKYGHVTYFWNGNRSGTFDDALEEYVEIPSDLVPFEQRPWMKAAEITDALIKRLRGGPLDFARLNYANGDMVGHTGHIDPSRVAVETVDLCLARLVPVVRDLGGVLVVTADHGNADQMIDRKKGVEKPRTSHSLNPVPLHVYDPARGIALDPGALAGANLGNVASTCLELLGLTPPSDYARSLLRR